MKGPQGTRFPTGPTLKRVWLPLVLCLLFLAGCQGTPQPNSSPPASPVAAAPSPVPSPTASSSLPPLPEATQAHTLFPTLTETGTPIPSPVETLSSTGTPSNPTGTSTPTTPPPVLFAAIGDYGLAGQAEADVAALIDSWQVDFVITVGDNNYPIGAPETIDSNIGQYYHAYLSPYRGEYGEGSPLNRFFPSLGNHDWIYAGARPYLDYFSLPGNERYYSFSWGPVELFALDSDEHEPDGFRRDSVQAAWLQDALAASQAPWKIVYFHHAPYTSGSYHGPSVWMQWPFEAWGASAVLAGHEHIYERLQIGGIPYFVNGLGGGAIYYLGDPVEGSLARYNDDWGAMRVEAAAEAIVFQFVNRLGEVVDEFWMDR